MKKKLVAALACRNQGTRLYGKPIQNLDIENGITIIDNKDKQNIEENILKYVKKLNEMSFDDRFEIGINAKSYTLQFNGVLEKYLKILKEEKIIIL